MKPAAVIPIETPVANDPALDALQDHVEFGLMPMHWVNAAGIIIWANKAELDMLGYTAEEYVGKPISSFHADEAIINDMLSRLHSNEALSRYESVLRCRDGSLKNVQISSNVYRENGAFIHTRCFTVDITEHKKLTTAIKESEFYHRQLLQNLKAPVYTTDAEGRITFYNKAAADLWGREPVIGVDLWCGSFRILNKDGGPIALSECPMAIALKEGRAVSGAEIMVIRPDGLVRHVAPHPEPVFDTSGKIIGAINMLIDITGIRNSEMALRESEKKMRMLATSLESEVETRTHALKVKNEELTKSEERYHKMIDEVEDYAIVLLDKDGIIQNWNKGAEKIKGYKDFEIIGKSFRSFYREEDRIKELPEKLLADAKDKGKAIHEGWRLRKDGTTFWGSIVITALHDVDRNVVGFSKVTRDLTERKLAEEQAAAYTRLLEFQNKELEHFAYAASHDLKEPLRKINFYNQYLLDNLKDKVDEKGADFKTLC